MNNKSNVVSTFLTVLVAFVVIIAVSSAATATQQRMDAVSGSGENVTPIVNDFAVQFPEWYFLSPAATVDPRYDQRIGALLNVDNFRVGESLLLPNPFDSTVMPVRLTGFDFDRGGYAVEIAHENLTEIYALVSWVQGNPPFIFVQRNGSVYDSLGFNDPSMTQIHLYGSTTPDAYGNIHSLAMLRFIVPADSQNPVSAIYILQQADEGTVLWFLSAKRASN